MAWKDDFGEVLARLEQQARHVQFHPQIEDLGRVQQIGDGVALVTGLDEATIDEVVVFANGVKGQVFDLGREVVGCMLYGPEEGIQASTPVFRTGQSCHDACGRRAARAGR